jgi:predicted nucleic acid-binding Zn ribbon protein
MLCEICGKEFTPVVRMSKAKYCSYECREIVRKKVTDKYNEKKKQKLKERDHSKRCPICGEVFQAIHNEIYCSMACKLKSNRLRKYGREVVKKDTTKKVPKEIKNLDDLMLIMKAEGKTPADYRQWKIEQSLKKVTPINTKI